ncbi:protein NRT1/ PTR FAMILY 5.2-like [Nymphaea colorata]|nr:protein NRT1/ PTR FAMILY 5.2-like [Nymphaea colorata]
MEMSEAVGLAEAKNPPAADANGGRYTKDGSVDIKGRPILRSKTGGWKACSFIVGYEVFERLAYYGISTNLILYLTTQLHQGTVTASNNVTNWVGTVWMTPILGAYIADAHLGRFWTFVISSIIYLMGLVLLTLAVSVPKLKPSPCHDQEGECRASSLQVGVFFLALYIVALGTGGTKPNISTMGADQFDEFEPRERKQKLSFFNWWMFSIFFGTLFANTFLVYIQDNVGWSLGYGIPTLGLTISILVFLVGSPFYRHKRPTDSPFAKMGRVLVAATRKWKAPLPSDPKELHELHEEEYVKIGMSPMESTSSLKSLSKAAVRVGPATRWSLCTVTQIEETKQMIKMIPIFLASFIPNTIIAQSHTLFIKQGTTLDRSMGPHFKIPPASLVAFITIFMLISLVIYDRWFVPFARKYTKNKRGITMLQRLGAGLFMHIIIMLISSLVEKKRLSYVRHHGLQNSKDPLPLSIFILLPQFALIGISDTFVEVAKIEFFYDQAPESMKSLGTSYFTSTLGVGNFFSSFLLKTVSKVTRHGGRGGWIRNNLNVSRLDKYFGLLAVVSALNFIYFLVASKYYVYRVEPSGLDVELQRSGELKTNKTYAEEGPVIDVKL